MVWQCANSLGIEALENKNLREDFSIVTTVYSYSDLENLSHLADVLLKQSFFAEKLMLIFFANEFSSL